MGYPLGATLAALLAVAGASLPWLTVRWLMPGERGVVRVWEVTSTGWTSSIDFDILAIPTWMVVPAALGAAGGAWLRWFAGRNIYPAVPLTLTLGGLLLTLAFVTIQIASRAGAVGVGSVVTAVAFLGLLVVTLAQSTSWSAKK
jgi:hypothetical protein